MLKKLWPSVASLWSYETVRKWSKKFGNSFAKKLKHHRPRLGDKWHLDEMFILINGKPHYLWRAVDQNGTVLDILVQKRRDQRAAKRFFCKLLKGLQYVPRVIVTDKLRSYQAAKNEVMPSVEHRRHKGLNNRAENSHQPTRAREKIMRRFKSPGQAQRFLSAFGTINLHFRPRRHLLTAKNYQLEMQSRFLIWREVANIQTTI